MKSKFKKLCLAFLTLLAATSIFGLSACAKGGNKGGNNDKNGVTGSINGDNSDNTDNGDSGSINDENGENNADEGSASTQPEKPDDGTVTQPEKPEDGGSGELNQEVNNMYIKVGDTALTATLVENSATQALKERLKTAPITINMSDYGGWEKVGGFGFDLPTSNEQITAQPCEFVLYQGNQLVIFYGSNPWSYTRLGKIEGVTQAELKEILGTGDVTVTLSLDK